MLGFIDKCLGFVWVKIIGLGELFVECVLCIGECGWVYNFEVYVKIFVFFFFDREFFVFGL